MNKKTLFLFVGLFGLLFVPGVLGDTGGTITYNSTHVIHTFTSNGTYVVTLPKNIQVLVVGGGGSGGGDWYTPPNNFAGEGGGGGGGLIYNSSYSASGNITVTVGTGGPVNTTGTSYKKGINGTDSIFGTLRAVGGGGGGSAAHQGANGGSGGGGAGGPQVNGSGTSGQGYAGGFNTGVGSPYAGSGGGGCGGFGGNATSSSVGGVSGIACQYSINGSLTNYSRGGKGANGWAAGAGANETGNTGFGGGGGGGQLGGKGADGIVIISYPLVTFFTVSATDIYNSSAITTFNATINGTFYSTTNGTIVTSIYTDAGGTITIVADAQYYFQNTTTGVSVASNKVMYMAPYTQIRVKDVAGSTINNFTVYAENNANTSETYNTTTTTGVGYVPLYNAAYETTVYDISNGTTDYATATANITANPYNRSYNFTVYTSNSIQFYIYDETNNTLINTTTTILYLTSSLISYNYSTSNGTLYVDLLSPAGYTITYSASGYGIREYEYTLTNQSTTTINLYLLAETEDDLAQVTVLDTTAQRVQDAIVKMQKKNLTGTNYYTVEMCTTDVLGNCLLHVNLYDTTYQFLIEYNTETKLNSGDKKVSNTAITFIISLENDLLQQYYEESSITGRVTYSSGVFSFVWNDYYNNLQNGCLKLERRQGNTISDYGTNNCSSSSTGTLMRSIDITLGDEWIATGFISFTDGRTNLTMGSASIVTSDFSRDMGKNGLLLFGFFLTGTIVFVGLYNPVVSVILMAFSLFTMNLLGFINIGTVGSITIIIIAAIVILNLRKT